MKRSTSLIIALVMCLAMPIGSVGAGDSAPAKAKLCIACHGADGNSVSDEFPSLAGQVPGYIAAQLALFKSGTRKNAIMAGMAAPLSLTDMAELDAYYSSKPLKSVSVPEDELATAVRGEKLYRGGLKAFGIAPCMACHGPAGRGIPSKYPRLAGQHPAYLERQLLAFKSKTRLHKAMNQIAFLLAPEQIREISLYVSALK